MSKEFLKEQYKIKKSDLKFKGEFSTINASNSIYEMEFDGRPVIYKENAPNHLGPKKSSFKSGPYRAEVVNSRLYQILLKENTIPYYLVMEEKKEKGVFSYKLPEFIPISQYIQKIPEDEEAKKFLLENNIGRILAIRAALNENDFRLIDTGVCNGKVVCLDYAYTFYDITKLYHYGFGATTADPNSFDEFEKFPKMEKGNWITNGVPTSYEDDDNGVKRIKSLIESLENDPTFIKQTAEGFKDFLTLDLNEVMPIFRSILSNETDVLTYSDAFVNQQRKVLNWLESTRNQYSKQIDLEVCKKIVDTNENSFVLKNQNNDISLSEDIIADSNKQSASEELKNYYNNVSSELQIFTIFFSKERKGNLALSLMDFIDPDANTYNPKSIDMNDLSSKDISAMLNGRLGIIVRKYHDLMPEKVRDAIKEQNKLISELIGNENFSPN